MTGVLGRVESENRVMDHSRHPLELVLDQMARTTNTDFLKSVCSYESVVHGIWVVGGDEVKGKQGDNKQCYESVDTGTLIGAEDLPPFHRPISQYHSYIERNNSREDAVDQ